ncbi:MAG: Ig-like domain-containing protein [Patescibacteria group bacterium]
MTKIKKALFGLTMVLACLIGLASMAAAAEFHLSPASDTLRQGCEYSANIMINTEGVETNAADAVIVFNPNDVEILDQVTNMPGVQVKPGTVYQMYPGNVVDEAQQRILLTGFNVIGGYTGTGVFGSIVFRSKPGVTNTNFNFYFVPGLTTDSNIADMLSNDVLTRVANASYTFVPGPCVDDTTPPWVQNPSPSPGQQGVPLSANVAFNILDNAAGVDLNAVTVKIEGIEYKLAGPNTFTYTGDPLNYRITVDTIQDFTPDTPVQVEIRGQDLSGNTMNPYIYTFNEPIPDTAPPYVQNPDPRPGQRDVPLNQNVAFNVLDNDSGVDINTVRIVVDGVTYQLSGPNTFSYTGDSGNFRVTVDPINNFPAGTGVSVEIRASDLAGNAMAPYRYRFNEPIPDNTPPWVQNPSPQPNQRDVPLDANVSFEILDDVSGVDIDSVAVSIDGILYTLAGANSFSRTGDPLRYFIEVNPIQDFPDQQAVIVEINARDLRGNVMAPYRYRFNEPIPPPPTCEELGCTCESMSCVTQCAPCEYQIPEPTVPPDLRLGLENVEFWAAGHTIQLIPNADHYVTVLPSQVYEVELDAEALPKAAASVEWLVAASAYRLARTQDGLLYKTSVQSDFIPGNYLASLIVNYLDGSIDVLKFGVTVAPFGLIYEESDGQQSVVSGALITLNRADGSTWPGSAYAQTNPMYSNSYGNFGYMVLPGNYRILIQKEGYRDKEVAISSSLIINPQIELIKRPQELPPITEVPELIGAVGENIEYAAQVVGDEFFNQPDVEQAASTIGAGALGALAAINLASLFTFAGFLPYLFSLFSEPILSLFPRKRKKYGTVYDSASKKPVELALIRLFDTNTNRLIKTAVTDKFGRYTLLVDPGSYYLRVFKKDFIFPSQTVSASDQEPAFTNIYHGEPLIIVEKSVINVNIPIDYVKQEVPGKRAAIVKYLRGAQRFIAIIGPVSALLVLLIKPNVLSAVLFAVHIILFALFSRISQGRKKQPTKLKLSPQSGIQ